MMEEAPDVWPPAEIPTGTVPVFPLPGEFLFPGRLLPLHIFELRYRQMIEDLMDQRGWLVISAIQDGHEDDALECPPFYEIGGLGEIVGHKHLEDGRFLVTLQGLRRVRVREVESDKPYRLVEFEELLESQPTGEGAVATTIALRAKHSIPWSALYDARGRLSHYIDADGEWINEAKSKIKPKEMHFVQTGLSSGAGIGHIQEAPWDPPASYSMLLLLPVL